MIPWKKEYCLGIESIDTQHKQLIDIINVLSQRIASGIAKHDVEIAIVDMERYVQTHFLFEEKFFTACRYEKTSEHIAEHHLFLEKTQEFRTRALTGDISLSLEMLGYLEDWFLHHVLVIDRQYVDDFKKFGVQ
ncbi:MAG: bacteriohemerythrin [Candidatus Moranbacteria bacterium]|nr:bacteriohemerythrin [Candidatus Moranbacteria bacterium]MDD3965308.1 bacteriohemerythrin [Candidatus Moranbacteria bacterium]